MAMASTAATGEPQREDLREPLLLASSPEIEKEVEKNEDDDIVTTGGVLQNKIHQKDRDDDSWFSTTYCFLFSWNPIRDIEETLEREQRKEEEEEERASREEEQKKRKKSLIAINSDDEEECRRAMAEEEDQERELLPKQQQQHEQRLSYFELGTRLTIRFCCITQIILFGCCLVDMLDYDVMDNNNSEILLPFIIIALLAIVGAVSAWNMNRTVILFVGIFEGIISFLLITGDIMNNTLFGSRRFGSLDTAVIIFPILTFGNIFAYALLRQGKTPPIWLSNCAKDDKRLDRWFHTCLVMALLLTLSLVVWYGSDFTIIDHGDIYPGNEPWYYLSHRQRLPTKGGVLVIDKKKDF